ncbi:Pimelyl-[acyl-carrier protein] methyl ester esterase [Marinobacter sp. BSs20148]|nr:Pimelyl-[acyl-carrier protein] methyl ester esterase [Marinobacter sp. BSs20148]
MPAAMLEPVYRYWQGVVQVVSLTDDGLSSCDSPAHAAEILLQRYPQPSVWLGWSLGAQVAMAAAQANPHSVNKVVTLGGFPQFVASQNWPWGVSPAIFRRFERYFEREPKACRASFFAQMIDGSEHQAEQVRAINACLKQGLPEPIEPLAKGVRWLRHCCQLHTWQQCPVPTLHLRGSCDASGSALGPASGYARSQPGA